ncbi:MAG: 1-acyl-sn-glycerol-3-phosphate acyltransferase [Pseudomonadota bacterium]
MLRSSACPLRHPAVFWFRLMGTRVSGDAEPALIPAIKDGSPALIYVLPRASRLDHLLMNAVALQLDLPATRFTRCAGRTRFFGVFGKSGARHRRIRSLVLKKTPSCVFLFKGRSKGRQSVWSEGIWEDLIRWESEERRQIRFVPVTILWGRTPDRVRMSLADYLFGDLGRPNLLRRLWILLKSSRTVRLRFGPPLDLEAFLKRSDPADAVRSGRKLRRTLASHLYRLSGRAAPPPIRERNATIETILRDPEVQDLIPSIARKEKKTEAEVEAKARKILDEVVSDYSPPFVAFSYRVFRWIWSHSFRNLYVDEEGFKRVEKVMLEHPVILAPSHKSHLDYMLISAILYEHDLRPPYIASGINLTFWPMEAFFRQNGAYFIRRRVSADLLYARLLHLYVSRQIHIGSAHELFIEGGRTRTGKVDFPKHGLLSMLVDAFLGGNGPDMFVVPISINYDRVPEDESYCAELTGTEKSRESFWILVKAKRFLRRIYGAGHVRFGKPISVREHFGGQPASEMPTKYRRARTLELAKDVARSIATETTVTLPSLGACALLAGTAREIHVPAWMESIRKLREYLLFKECPLSPQARDLEENADWLLNFFLTNEWITPTKRRAAGDRFLLREDRRLNLDFYKNTILHDFLPPVLFATAFGDGKGSVAALEARAGLLSPLLGHEFPVPPGTEAHSMLEQGRAWMLAHPSASTLFSGLAANYVEGYDWTARFLLLRKQGRAHLSGAHVLAALKYGNQLLARGEISHREAVSAALLRSAYSYFNRHGLLEDSSKLESWRLELSELPPLVKEK